jgi:hypothetical protein
MGSNRGCIAALIAATMVLAGCGNSTPLEPAGAPITPPVASGKVRAGVAVVDDTWQVGACAGQYCDDNSDVQELIAGGEVDPFLYHRAKDKSYGVQSRLSARAIVVEGSNGKRIALLKTDNYLAQDMLLRRVGQILDEGPSGIGYQDILYTVAHNHTSPYYATISWGVWVFEDVYDQRAFEFQARKMAQAIELAAANLKPARLGATVVRHTIYKGNVVRPAIASDGTPAGYPLEYNDHDLTVLRFDDLSDPAQPRPMALWVNFGMHPESLDGPDLHSADFLAPLERFIARDLGVPLLWSQGDVGSSENSGNTAQILDDQGGVCGQWPEDEPAPTEYACAEGEGVLRDWQHRGFVQTERNVRYLADAIIRAHELIGAGDPSVVIPLTSDFPVDRLNAFIPGPLSHPYPSVSNCNTDSTLGGDPGVPVLGLPDCARLSDQLGDPYTALTEPLLPIFGGVSQLAALGRAAGVPVPDHYDFTGFTAVEENLRIRLQAFRLGEILLASCACEAQNDLILNLKSRTDTVAGNIYDGFDWACLLPEHEAEAVCQQQKRYYDPTEFPTTIPGDNFDADAIAHMRAQVHNDARGWDAPENALAANSEPVEIARIWGNFTKEELPPELGYKLPVGVGHAGDYNGYTVSYREYMNRDSYRKALTTYGAHTADYMVTRLVRMAASLRGGPPLAGEFLAPVAALDEVRQQTLATVLGLITSPAYDAWIALVPDDVGPARVLAEPVDIERFSGATFSWVGGSTAIDNPTARVEREGPDGQWQPYADMTGEVQTKVEFPEGAAGVIGTYLGTHEWHWTANFEAYAAAPARLGSTPPGRYRFVVDGNIRQSGADQAYHFESAPFAVSHWGGVGVADAAVDGAGNVSFSTPPVQYPRSYVSAFRYIQDDADPRICETCTFRPWARASEVQSARVSVQRAAGMIEVIDAARSGTAWSVPTTLAAGDRAFIAPGDLRDTNLETNRAEIPLVSR